MFSSVSPPIVNLTFVRIRPPLRQWVLWMEGNINISREMIYSCLFLVAKWIKNSLLKENSSKLKRWNFHRLRVFCPSLKRAIGIEIFLGWSFLWIWGHLHTLYSWERPTNPLSPPTCKTKKCPQLRKSHILRPFYMIWSKLDILKVLLTLVTIYCEATGP